MCFEYSSLHVLLPSLLLHNTCLFLHRCKHSKHRRYFMLPPLRAFQRQGIHYYSVSYIILVLVLYSRFNSLLPSNSLWELIFTPPYFHIILIYYLVIPPVIMFFGNDIVVVGYMHKGSNGYTV